MGGGSSIDTAKAINLLTTNPGELMDYINVPVGKGQAPTQPLKPLVAVPTTTGTGLGEHHDLRDGRALAEGQDRDQPRPAAARPWPSSTRDLTFTQPPGVTAASGMDILCHALESYTARWYTTYDRKKPEQRVPYCGSNPISDMWSEKALTLLAGSFRRAVRHGDDAQARADMAMAATFAGMGFGNAGVHIPHANAYPDRRAGEGLPPEGLPGRRADGAARDVGGPDRAGGLPLHVRGVAGAARPGRAAARPERRPADEPRPSSCRRCWPT